MHDVDLFVFYDDVKYTKGDWRNRNRIKTPHGLEWLTIPVGDQASRSICDVEIRDRSWASAHWRRLRQHYAHAPHFERYRPWLEEIYVGSRWLLLSELNQTITATIAREFLRIPAEIQDSRAYSPTGRKLDRLLDLLAKADATVYVSGPAAKAYIDPARFAAAGIELVWKDYSRYPEYPQFFPPFAHEVTVLDLLFHTGPEAPSYIWAEPSRVSCA